MHFTQCRETLTEAAVVGGDNKTHVALIAGVHWTPHITDLSTAETKGNVPVIKVH